MDWATDSIGKASALQMRLLSTESEVSPEHKWTPRKQNQLNSLANNFSIKIRIKSLL